ncbi:MAG: DUF4129 domain-containing protein [Gemmataceae bacterium]|nr:DUF4129 domain-containing protein [Gemmataceae bacterium]
MAASREPPPLADLVVTAVSPVLVVLMVGSLVFFLVEVLYAGQYSDRLLYSLFFFVVGAVLVARISIQADPVRAGMYGLGLGLVTFLAMSAYVEYPPGTPLRSVAWLVNLGLMGVVWASAHKLTWDCTHIDEKQASSGRGVLAAAGLDADQKAEVGGQKSEDSDQKSEPVSRDPKGSAKKAKKKKKKGKHDTALWTWIGRYQKHREAKKAKGHTPGVWVIYFALAALPLFALGQSLVDPDDDARRFRTFVQMAVYVASALGLLVTTSFLGLRRYLRQRKVKIPAALTASWLGLGGVLIVAFLVLGTFLPRPHSEVPWFGIQRAGKSEREASKYAQLRDGAGKGEGADGDQTEKGNGIASGKNGEPGGGKGEKGSGGSGEGKGSGGGKDAKSSRGNGGQKSQSGNDKSGDSKSDDEDRNQRSGRDADKDGNEAKNNTSSNRSGSSTATPPGGVMAAVEKVAGVLKWIIFAVIAFLAIVGVVLAVLRYLAPFTDWAKNLLDALRNFWASLFGSKKQSSSDRDFAPEALGPVRPPPFHDFSNPFEDGTASGRDPRELVAYTFAALDAWAWDRGHGRQEMETPLEFAARLGGEFAELRESLKRFAALYARAAYSTLPLPADVRQQLEAFWDELVHGAGVVAVN